MTKKDYKLIAESINAARQYIRSENKDCGLNFLVGYLGEELKNDNPNFQYDKFKLACGLK